MYYGKQNNYKTFNSHKMKRVQIKTYNICIIVMITLHIVIKFTHYDDIIIIIKILFLHKTGIQLPF